MGSEYALIYMNVSNCARILAMPESAKNYPNVAGEFGRDTQISEYA